MLTENDIDMLVTDLAHYSDDPLGFVLWAFPWGEPGPLESFDGPEKWQREQLERIGERLREGGDDGAVIIEDVSSGHGVGKSAEVSWLILWAVMTREDTRGVVTANTDSQLRTKTWAELSKWFGMCVASPLFSLTATALYSVESGRDKSWRIDQIPWSKERSEAFAGLHNQGGRILVLFDEASAIDDVIWEVTEGALTDANTQIIWCRYGNPTRTTGAFHRACTQPKTNHVTRVDSRDVSWTNQKQIAQWIEDYGEDSDFVRVRVKGQFPRKGQSNFIDVERVEVARRNVVALPEYAGWPLLLSLDPARFGEDSSVPTLRQGQHIHWQREWKGLDGIDMAGRVLEIVREHPDIQAIIYDVIGIGADLDSALKRTPGLPRLVPVSWGVPARDSTRYYNQRAECWSRMREWLKAADIPDDDDLANQLTCLDYGYDAAFRIQLQSKKDIRRNGGKSPDKADSLALSFVLDAVDVAEAPTRARAVTHKNAAGWT